jgi:hypothetical protein
VSQPTTLLHDPKPVKLNYIFLSDKFCSGFVKAKLIFILAKFKMAASATVVKELQVLKQCCNPLNYTFQDIPKTYCGVFAPCGM